MDQVTQALVGLRSAVAPMLPNYAGPPVDSRRVLSDLVHAASYVDVTLSQLPDAPEWRSDKDAMIQRFEEALSEMRTALLGAGWCSSTGDSWTQDQAGGMRLGPMSTRDAARVL